MTNDTGNGNDRGKWGSRWGFILAAAGSAVGLGNIWKFPYITGENGGGLFVLIYLVCIAFVGLPIMVAEIMIGRAARQQPVAAFEKLQGGKTGWSAVGWLGVAAGFIILSYYCVVAGWAMDYTLKTIINFGDGPAKQAAIESKRYRATEEQSRMRDLLANHEVDLDEQFRKWTTTTRLPLKPSEWRKFDIYEAAKAEAEKSLASKPELTMEVVDQLLLEDESLAEIVPRAKEINAAIAKKRQEVSTRHLEQITQWGELEVRDKAEDQVRRVQLAALISERFDALSKDGWTSSFWAVLFMVITIVIVSGGISSGIERTCKILMPVLMALIGVMVLYGMTQPGFGAALSFVFSPDPSALHTHGVLEALGHAFFTLSLGMGAMITYGSYQEEKDGLMFQAIWITIFDTLIALAACMMIFPITFSFGQPPQSGPGLVFVSMPLAFSELGAGGVLLGIMFFGLLVFAALTSAISLLEVCCSYFIDAKGWSRRRAAITIGSVITFMGTIVAFSSDPDFLLSSWLPGYGTDFFSTWDTLASNWLLPLGGLFIAIYAGWIMPKRFRDAEVEGMAPALIGGWLLLVRFIAPALVLLVLAQKAGIIEF